MSLRIKGQEHFSRRRFLLNSAKSGAVLALPHFASLESGFAAKPSATPAKRLVVIHIRLGLYDRALYPKVQGRDYEPTTLLKPLESFRDRYTLFNGLDHPNVTGGHEATSTLLTGENFNLRPNQRHGISIDQVIANQVGDQTRFDKLILTTAPGVSTQVSYNENGTPFPDVISSPYNLYHKLYTAATDSEKAMFKESVRHQRSILDGAKEEARRMSAKLDAEDRARFDQYLTSVRDLERSLEKQMEWDRLPKPAVPGGLDEPPRRLSVKGMHDYMPSMFDLAALALQTDSTRVMTLSIPAGQIYLEGMNFTAHYHQLSHHGKREDNIKQLVAVEEAHMKQVASFLTQLTEMKDANGAPMLDSTTVMLSSGIGNAHSHSNQHLPVMVIGGDYRHRGYVDLREKDIPLCNLYVDFAQRMGVDLESFSSSTGGFSELS